MLSEKRSNMDRRPSFAEFMKLCSSDCAGKDFSRCQQIGENPTERQLVFLPEGNCDSEKGPSSKNFKSIDFESERKSEFQVGETNYFPAPPEEQQHPGAGPVLKNLSVKIKFQTFPKNPVKATEDKSKKSSEMRRFAKCRICDHQIAVSGSNGNLRLTDMKRHASRHFGEKLLTCPLCPKSFVSLRSAQCHISRCHNSTEPVKTVIPVSEFEGKLEKLLIRCFGTDFFSARKVPDSELISLRKPEPDSATPEMPLLSETVQCKLCRKFIVSVDKKKGGYFCPSYLRKHTLSHCFANFFGCPLCSFENKWVQQVKRHIGLTHKEEEKILEPLKLRSDKEMKDAIEQRMKDCFGLDFDGVPLKFQPESQNSIASETSLVISATTNTSEMCDKPEKTEISLPPENVSCKICKMTIVAGRFEKGKIRFRPSSLRQHVLVYHSANKFFLCPLCSHKGKTARCIRSHLRKIHGQKEIATEPLDFTQNQKAQEEVGGWMRECFGMDFNGVPTPNPQRKRLRFKSEPIRQLPDFSETSSSTESFFTNLLRPEKMEVDGGNPPNIDIFRSPDRIQKQLKFRKDSPFSEGSNLNESSITKLLRQEKFEVDGASTPEIEIVRIPDRKLPRLQNALSPSDGDPTRKKCKICRVSIRCASWKRGKMHSAASSLRYHAALHVDGRFHKCPFCEKRMKIRQSIVTHINHEHKGAKISPDSFLTISEKEYNDKLEPLMNECFEVDLRGQPL